ncbi:MAG: GIY-YIG nuclease family protein [Balneola sp.]|nr:GIY-YIG nuclease family protein [Balneola sp.]MBO6649610.1 GIY-YIG nuclease family protein [Balneola sp.]MBO6711427.1 GIY-YIG nuclease family protein [Balneola sp.]MBO6801219.1 GIY-YIG nuclease family protein [Balneola sp.]MBO6869363.1 GIY-YIG nuclease family protein [Balneola sp.]
MSYYVYITTNSSKTTLYVGMTNDIPSRILEHGLNAGNPETFAGKYHCFNLLYYEEFQYVNDAIAREKEIKKWRRDKKEQLINSVNPEWRFLNKELGLYPFGDYADERNIKNRR